MGKLLIAIAQAVAYWVILNLAISQFFVIYRWNECHPTVIHDRIEEVVIEKLLDPVVTEEIIIKEILNDPVVEIVDDNLRAQAENLQRLMNHAQSKLSHQLQECRSKVGYLVRRSAEKRSYPQIEIPSVEGRANSLFKLLALPSLNHVPQKELIQLMTDSMRELDAVTRSKTAKSLFNALLAFNFERMEPPATNLDCPSPQTGARASDFHQTMQFLHATIEQRCNEESLKKLWSEIKLEEFMSLPLPDSVLAEVANQRSNQKLISTLPDSVDDDNRICLLEDDLIDMIELALQQSPADLQSQLTNFVKEIDPDSDLILDAMLPRSYSSPSKLPSRPASPINLRQALNSELFFYGSTKIIDTVVDWIGGYNDELDSALDSLVQTHDASGEQSVGRILMSRLLQLAGEVPLPLPIVALYNNSQAGVLFGIS